MLTKIRQVRGLKDDQQRVLLKWWSGKVLPEKGLGGRPGGGAARGGWRGLASQGCVWGTGEGLEWREKVVHGRKLGFVLIEMGFRVKNPVSAMEGSRGDVQRRQGFPPHRVLLNVGHRGCLS